MIFERGLAETTVSLLQTLPLDSMGLAKSAALVRLGEDRTALLLTLGPAQPDPMLPPSIAVAPCVTAPSVLDVTLGTAIIRGAVEAAGASVVPIATMGGTPLNPTQEICRENYRHCHFSALTNGTVRPDAPMPLSSMP